MPKIYKVFVSEQQGWTATVEAKDEDEAKAIIQRVLDRVGHSALEDVGSPVGYEIEYASLESDDDNYDDVTIDAKDYPEKV